MKKDVILGDVYEDEDLRELDYEPTYKDFGSEQFPIYERDEDEHKVVMKILKDGRMKALTTIHPAYFKTK